MTRAAAAAVGLLLLVVTAGAVRVDLPTVVEPGTPVQPREGQTLHLAPGRHAGFSVDVAATIKGAPGAVVDGGIVVTSDDVHLAGLRITGGDTGVLVRGATDVVLDDVVVDGAGLHGIEVVEGAATIRGCSVRNLASPYAQGIEVRNSAGLGQSRIEACTFDGGQEGIVAHVSRVRITGNAISNTTQRAITVTEMSEGLIEGNAVREAVGSGIYCGDMSHCEIRANTIDGVAAGARGIRSEAGHAVVGLYYATLRAQGNVVNAAAGQPMHLSVGAVATDRFPLGLWPAGWRGALGVIPTTVAWVAILGFALFALSRTVRWEPRQVTRSGSLAVLAGAGALQVFHQFEHTLQVWQVMVADAERRSGLLGAAVDSEWLHFGFNVGLFVLLLVGIAEVRRATIAPVALHATRWLLAATAIQTYHLAEHVAKLAQHIALGIDPAPGIIGVRFGLVPFHFAINTAVTLGMLGATMIVMRGRTRTPDRAVVGPAPAVPVR